MKPWLSLSLKYGRRHSTPFVGVLALVLLDVGFNVLSPWPLKLMVDNAFTGEPLPNSVKWIAYLPGADAAGIMIAWLALGTLLLFISRQIVQMIKGYLQVGAATRVKIDLAGEVFLHLQMHSLRFHNARKAGDLLQRVTSDTDFIRSLIVGVVLPALISLATLFFMFWIMHEINQKMTYVALLAALPLPFLMKWFTPRMKECSYQQYQAEGELMAVAEQAITSLPVIQAFGRESDEVQRFRGSAVQVIGKYLRSMNAQLQYTIIVGSVTALGTAVLIMMGGLQVQEGQLSIGSLLVFLAYLAAIYQPLETLASLSASYADSEGQARRVMEVLDVEYEIVDRKDAKPFQLRSDQQGIEVTFKDVTFGYEPEQPVLSDINLSVKAGETIALVGATGAGKTTLASLVPRFMDPWQGRVLFDGVDVRDYQLHSLREQVSLVLQEPFLLPLTVAENIAYGRPAASSEEINAAAKAANAEEFIRRLPDGYNTVIGERGATLSGGQRQRLAIARALLKDAPILILDEPTSALDARTEARILEALERLMANRTTFIIAHRLSTIRNADRIIVLKDGKIVEQGTHEELIVQNGTYKQFVELNRQGEMK